MGNPLDRRGDGLAKWDDQRIGDEAKVVGEDVVDERGEKWNPGDAVIAAVVVLALDEDWVQ